MSFEKGLIELILSYCTDGHEKSFENLLNDCLSLCRVRKGPYDEARFHLQYSNFPLLGIHNIKLGFEIQGLMIVSQSKWEPHRTLCRRLSRNQSMAIGQIQNEMMKVNITHPFLCCMEFFDTYIPPRRHQLPVGGQSRHSIQTAASFTDDVTGVTLFGLLRGSLFDEEISSMGQIPKLHDVQFYPLKWMGNPSEMKTLEMYLNELDHQQCDGCETTQNFNQQFCWWFKEDQKVYWQSIQDMLLACFSCHLSQVKTNFFCALHVTSSIWKDFVLEKEQLERFLLAPLCHIIFGYYHDGLFKHYLIQEKKVIFRLKEKHKGDLFVTLNDRQLIITKKNGRDPLYYQGQILDDFDIVDNHVVCIHRWSNPILFLSRKDNKLIARNWKHNEKKPFSGHPVQIVACPKQRNHFYLVTDDVLNRTFDISQHDIQGNQGKKFQVLDYGKQFRSSQGLYPDTAISLHVDKNLPEMFYIFQIQRWPGDCFHFSRCLKGFQGNIPQLMQCFEINETIGPFVEMMTQNWCFIRGQSAVAYLW